MNRNSWLLNIGLALAFVLGTSAGLYVVAQEETNPFAEEKGPADKKGKGKDAEDAAPPPAPIAEEKEHPVIRALRESDPKTLDQLTRAARITMQMSRADEFKRYAQAWLALKPSDADLAALNRKYGSAMFFEMSRRKEFQPEGKMVAGTVLDGAAKFTRDPTRLDDLIGKLGGPDSVTHGSAVRGLREAGAEGIVALIHALADEAVKADREAVRDTLVLLGRDSVDPLIAALAAPQAQVRADAAEVLGRLKARDSAVYLVALAAAKDETPDRTAAREALKQLSIRVPQADNAASFLQARIRGLLAGELPGQLDENDQVALWRWDETANSVRLDRYPREEASLVVADRLAGQLIVLAGNDPELIRLALLVQLEADKTFAGLDEPLPQGKDTAWALAHSLDVDALEAALVDAIKLDRPTAIAAVLEVLGASGRPELLTKYPAGESPLVTALGYPDRRVQVAALKAIFELDPSEAYPGASRVVETMKLLLSSKGKPRVLVGHHRFDEGRRIASLYSELGYEADSATTGSALVRQAAENADYELILVSETIDKPTISETMQTLRKDPRSARIPVGIMQQFVVLDPTYVPPPLDEHSKPVIQTTKERVAALLADERHAPQRLSGQRAELAAEVVELAVVVPAPQSTESLNFTHNQVMRLAPTRLVPPELRLQQASYVLDRLADLMSRKQPPKYYDYSRLEEAVEFTLRLPPLTRQATQVLALYGTPKAQSALVEQASLSSVPPEQRQAAAKALDEAVRRRGLYLTQAQIQTQYDRFNTETDDESKVLLGQVLDSIEAPTTK